MDGVLQVALPGIMQPQPQVLMAYKSPSSSFIQLKRETAR